MITGCFADGHLLSRRAGTLSSTPSGGEGWGEEAPLKDSTESHCEMESLLALGKMPGKPAINTVKGAILISRLWSARGQRRLSDAPRQPAVSQGLAGSARCGSHIQSPQYAPSLSASQRCNRWTGGPFSLSGRAGDFGLTACVRGRTGSSCRRSSWSVAPFGPRPRARLVA